MKRKNSVFMLAVASFMSFNSWCMDDKRADEAVKQLRTYFNEAILPPQLGILKTLQSGANEITNMITMQQRTRGLSQADALLASTVITMTSANLKNQQKLIEVISNCIEGKKQPEDLNKLRETIEQKLKELENQKRELSKQSGDFAQLGLAQIKISQTIHQSFLKGDVLGTQAEPGIVVKCEHPNFMAAVQRFKEKEEALKAPQKPVTVEKAPQTAAQEFKKSYPALAAFDIATLDLTKKAETVAKLLLAIKGQAETDKLETVSDEKTLKSLEAKYMPQLYALKKFTEDNKQDISPDDLNAMLREISSFFDFFEQKKYPALAQLNYNFEDYSLKPWNAKTNEEAKKVLDEMFADLNGLVAGLATMTDAQKKMNEDRLKNIKENYVAAVNEVKNFIQAHFSADHLTSWVAQLQTMLETLRTKYNDYFNAPAGSK